MNCLSVDIRVPLGEFALEIREDIPLSGVTALVGRSASGKSSLLRAIAGLDPCEGTIRFDGETWNTGKHMTVPAHRRKVGFVFQDIRLFEHLDVAGNISFARRWQNGQGVSDAGLEEIVDILDLKPLMHRQSARLSGGERQRVALARALAAKPGIMLLDEPLSGLDPVQKDRLLPRIQRALEIRKCPAIFVSHDRLEVARFSDRSLTIARGEVEARQSALPVFEAVCTDAGAFAEFAGARLRLPDPVSPGKIRFRFLADRLSLSTEDPGRTSAALAVRVKARTRSEGRYELLFPHAPDQKPLVCPQAWTELALLSDGGELWLSAFSVAVLSETRP